MAQTINKIILLGRLGKDPELKYTEKGKPYCQFQIATQWEWATGGKKGVDWHRISLWGERAEMLVKNARKGSYVLVIGRMESRLYNQNGEKKMIAQVVPDTVMLPEGGGDLPDRAAKSPAADDTDDGFSDEGEGLY